MSKQTKTKTKTKNNTQTFLKDLRLFRERWPMCYIEAWTPEDYANAANPAKSVGSVDWDDPAHIETSDNLDRHFDANIGTSWDRVRLELE